jgi:hypothetical protein
MQRIDGQYLRNFLSSATLSAKLGRPQLAPYGWRRVSRYFSSEAVPSLIETCKLCGVEPQAYLTDVLTKLVNLWPASRLDELMPWAWAAERSHSRAPDPDPWL